MSTPPAASLWDAGSPFSPAGVEAHEPEKRLIRCDSESQERTRQSEIRDAAKESGKPLFDCGTGWRIGSLRGQTGRSFPRGEISSSTGLWGFHEDDRTESGVPAYQNHREIVLGTILSQESPDLVQQSPPRLGGR